MIVIIIILLIILSNVLFVPAAGPLEVSWQIADFLRGLPFELGTMQRRLAWPPRKDDTRNSRSVNNKRVTSHIFGCRNISPD